MGRKGCKGHSAGSRLNPSVRCAAGISCWLSTGASGACVQQDSSPIACSDRTELAVRQAQKSASKKSRSIHEGFRDHFGHQIIFHSSRRRGHGAQFCWAARGLLIDLGQVT